MNEESKTLSSGTSIKHSLKELNEKMDPSLTLCTEVQTALEESQAFQFFPTQKPSLESFWQRILNSFFVLGR